jgi:hypothetical protein
MNVQKFVNGLKCNVNGTERFNSNLKIHLNHAMTKAKENLEESFYPPSQDPCDDNGPKE